jgi:hypothetical protein
MNGALGPRDERDRTRAKGVALLDTSTTWELRAAWINLGHSLITSSFCAHLVARYSTSSLELDLHVLRILIHRISCSYVHAVAAEHVVRARTSRFYT